MKCEAVIIGATIADILLQPVPTDVFARGSVPAETVRMSFGGDALNEATVLNRLGHTAVLVTELGADEMGKTVAAHCRTENVPLYADYTEGLSTGINTVLITADGERSFITNPNSSLRTLSMRTITPFFESEEYRSAKVISLASMFVSFRLSLSDMHAIFSRVRSDGKFVCADMTKRKFGETLSDASEALSCCDLLFANLDEAALLSGLTDADEIADAFLATGLGTLALKLGSHGCLIASRKEHFRIPAFQTRCVDTTGAGDNFAAAFLAAKLEGRSLRECAAFANACASFCVEQVGATASRPAKAEIEARAATLL